MSHLFLFAVSCLLLNSAAAQKKWDGEGVTGQWDDSLNWSMNTVPGPSDEVVLDNSVVAGSYTVVLPTTLAVTVGSITINPANGKTIELSLPSTNTLIPALTTTAQPYGLILNRGAVFRNASGANSGLVFDAQDSIRINNGGRYVHNSGAAHAANVNMLSSAPGTEEGIWEFDIPDASSTISLSGRNFGTLELNAMSGVVPKNYTAAGTNTVHIRSDLRIGDGLNLKLNFDDSILIERDLIQDGGLLDLGTTARSVKTIIKGNLVQQPGATITETGTGLQQITLSGKTEQQVDLRGGLINAVQLDINNSEGVKLMSPLSIAFQLKLTKGAFRTSSAAMLTIASTGIITADTIVAAGFISGPLRKEGLLNDYFLFPVGRNDVMRWLAVQSATEDVQVEYFQEDPRLLSSVYSPGIDHISALEYWKLEKTAAGGFPITLSFDQQHSGEVSNLADLRVGALAGTGWQNAGNNGVGGTPGFTGWVQSALALAGAGAQFVTLASSASNTNALPLSGITLRGTVRNGLVILSWELAANNYFIESSVQSLARNGSYQKLYTSNVNMGQLQYGWNGNLNWNECQQLRIEAIDKSGGKYYSNVINLAARMKRSVAIINLTRDHQPPSVLIQSETGGRADLRVISMDGKMLSRRTLALQSGKQIVPLTLPTVNAGCYAILINFDDGDCESLRLCVKP